MVLLFSIAGGLTSVAYTNTFSFVITIIALPVLWFFARSHAVELGGVETVFDEKYLAPNPSGMWEDSILPFRFIFSTYFLGFFLYMQAPWNAQNMFAAKNERIAYGGMAMATALIVILYGLSIQTAVFTKVGFQHLDDPQNALPFAVTYLLPVGIRGILLAVILAVCQTTMASIWNNTVSIFTQDVYRQWISPKASEKRVLFTSRAMTLGIAVFTIIVSITLVDQVINVFYFANMFIASLFFPVLGGFLWWRAGEKASWISAILGIASGLTIHFLVKQTNPEVLNSWMLPYYAIAVPCTIGLGIIISHLERPRKAFLEKKAAFYQKVGAPWFGKKAYFQYLKDGTIK
jgi:Na+/proline symporter